MFGIEDCEIILLNKNKINYIIIYNNYNHLY